MRTLALTALLFIFAGWGCSSLFVVVVDSLPTQHDAAFEAISTRSPTLPYFISEITPNPHSIIPAGVHELRISVRVSSLVGTDVDEIALRNQIAYSARLEINSQDVRFPFIFDQPPLLIVQGPWDRHFTYSVELEEGMYLLQFSFSTLDNEVHSYNWTYQVE